VTVVDFYARKSSKDLGRSVARQERLFRADCATEGLTPGRVFLDPDFSASRYAKRERPDYEALVEHIRSARCEMFSIWEVTRGSRQMGEWVHLLDLTREMGVLIRVIGEGGADAQTYDPRRQRDREYLLKEALAAEGEVERTRSRMKAGAAVAASEGRPHGFVKDGYKREYGPPTSDSVTLSGARRREVRQVIDEPRAEIYRAAAEGLLNDVPADRIASILMAWGVPTPRGAARWHGSSIVKAVLSPTLEGHRVENGKVVKRDAWPAIIDPATAAALRSKFSVPSPRWKAQDTRLRHFLAAAMSCGRCQAPMGARVNEYLLRRTPPPTDGTLCRYECTPDRGGCGRVSAPMRPLEALVNELVVARLRQPDALAVFAPAQDDAALIEAKAGLELLIARRDELYAEAAKPGGPSMALVAAAERQLLPQIDEAEARVRALRTPPVLRGFDPADLAARWLEYSVGDRRSVALALAEIVVSPAGRGVRWSPARLARSRWRGDSRTWGELWAASV
jgi:DNA invertase Pin-like site-specific DNA recombinase